jgi:hypothetical protein
MTKPRFVIAASAALALAVALTSARAIAITRCDVIADAQSWVDHQVVYHRPGGCPGPAYCDPLRPGQCYRPDCSGLVSAAWALPGPGHVTYSLAGGPWDDHVSYGIAAEQLEPGDALNYPGDPNAGTGHVMLYVSGTWAPGHSVEVIEESGCGKVAMRHMRAYDGKFHPIRYTGIEPCVKPFAGVSSASGNASIAVLNWTDQDQWPSDGHPELFVRRASGELAHLWAKGDGDDWSAPEALGKGIECGFAAGFWPAPKSYPEVFGPRTGASAVHTWLANPQWSPMHDYGGTGHSSLATLAWGDGRLEVFALGADRAIHHNWWDPNKNDWSGWQSMQGSFATGASAILWGDGHAELFATDAKGTAWHNWSGAFASGWHGWEPMQGRVASRPVPVRWPDGHLDVFARGADGQLRRSGYVGGWSELVVESAGVRIVGEPFAAMNPDGAGTPAGPEVVARSEGGKVVHLWWDGGKYRTFEPLGDQAAASDPVAWVRADGTMQVFAIDPKGQLVQIRRDASKQWGSWKVLGGGFDACEPAGGGGEPEPGGKDAGASGEDAGTAGKDAGASGKDAGPAGKDAGKAGPFADAGLHSTSEAGGWPVPAGSSPGEAQSYYLNADSASGECQCRLRASRSAGARTPALLGALVALGAALRRRRQTSRTRRDRAGTRESQAQSSPGGWT